MPYITNHQTPHSDIDLVPVTQCWPDYSHLLSTVLCVSGDGSVNSGTHTIYVTTSNQEIETVHHF